jgi:hypothetical protein
VSDAQRRLEAVNARYLQVAQCIADAAYMQIVDLDDWYRVATKNITGSPMDPPDLETNSTCQLRHLRSVPPEHGTTCSGS